jgi:hypothetical protein
VVSINFLSKIKNNFAIIYSGSNPCVAAKLVILKRNMLNKFPKLNIWLVFQKYIQEQYPQFPLVINFETFKEFGNNFTKQHEVSANPKEDPILQFCHENEIDMVIAKAEFVKTPKIALISNGADINILQKFKNKFSGMVVIDPDLKKTIDIFNCVAGIESPDLIASAARGKKIYLLGSGLGCNSFRKMFPDTELFEA